jgi:cytochrome c5
MFSISRLLSKGYRNITAGGAALLLSSVMISSAGAADIATTYNNSCAACHDSGALNAIKKGDSAKWQQLIKQKSMPALIKSVKGGMPQMPAGGLCNKCSDDDYRELIEYMSK